ncbi:hypothetical protein [Roseibium aggregatum]|uniref:Uncharacterized protein n=1 Tax=Roseibium aggregatum TaxID=187304 RepID=A0A926S7H3_9HYPH|nr:hypothetical protein [Roseibium aggregatum]MBD1549653.1 hypothetical protein [Roseibium aggregatum]
MLFNIEHDQGYAIQGYFVPDGFSETATIAVYSKETLLAEIPCTQVREAVLQSRRHDTGEIGFQLDETLIPNLQAYSDLSIFDRKTGILIYQRFNDAYHVPLKLFRMEFSLLQDIRIDNFVRPYFQYHAAKIDNYGHETALQAFHLNLVRSSFISGRLMFRNYEQFFDKDYQAIAAIPDPYQNFAERLVLFSRFKTINETLIPERDRIQFSIVADYFEGLDLKNIKEIKNKLEKMPKTVRSHFRSPIVHQLVSTMPGQTIDRLSVPLALDALSRFRLVTLAETPDRYANGIAALLGTDANAIRPRTIHENIVGFASKLSEIHVIETLLEEDLIFYHFLQQALSMSNEFSL